MTPETTQELLDHLGATAASDVVVGSANGASSADISVARESAADASRTGLKFGASYGGKSVLIREVLYHSLRKTGAKRGKPGVKPPVRRSKEDDRHRSE